MNPRRAISGLKFSASALALATMLSFGSAHAASTTSNVQGFAGPAAAGKTVTATNLDTGEKGVAKVGPDGNYFIVGLSPGKYRVQLGDSTKSATLPVDETIYVDFGENVVGEVVVAGRKGRNPELDRDARSTSIATIVTQEQIENLPQYDRNFLNFASLAPGITVSPPNTGTVTFSGGATTSDNTNVYIDGESFKNQVGHGGVAGQNFTQGNPFPQLAVDQFKVETQNFKAEYEQAGGAIINASTKSGTNAFHGDAYVDDIPKSFFGIPYFSRPGNANNPGGAPQANYNRTQYGADISGPIIKDRLFFFVAVEGTQQDEPATPVTLFPGTTTTTSEQAIASKNNGQYATNFSQQLVFGKLTWRPTDADLIDLTVFDRIESNRADFGGTTAPSAGHSISDPLIDIQLQWRHRGNNWQNELSLSYQNSDNSTPDLTSGPATFLTTGCESFVNAGQTIPVGTNGPTCTSTNATGAVLGANFFTQQSAQKEYTFRDYFTYTGLHFAGDHVIKVGIKNDALSVSRNFTEYLDGGFYYNAATYQGNGSDVPYAANIALGSGINKPPAFNDDQLGVFIQDDWTYGKHLTVNYGLRWDYESNEFDNDYVTPDAIVQALRSYEPWQAAGINPNNYISTGHNRHPYLGEFQPRIGVSYDVHGDRDLVLFAGWGRYYDHFTGLDAATERDTDSYTATRLVYFGSGPGQIPYNPSYLTNPQALSTAVAGTLSSSCVAVNACGAVWLLNNNTPVPYTDELDIGVRKRFGSVQTSISYVHQMSYNGFQYVRGNRLPDGSYPSYNGQFLTYDNFPACGQLGWNGKGWTQGAPGTAANCNTAIAAATFNGKLDIGQSNAKTRYDGLLITVEKPYTEISKWGAGLSITIDRAQSNNISGVESVGSVTDDEAYEGPSQTSGGWHDAPGIPRYSFVGWGIVKGPWETKFSANVNLNSGPAFGTFGCGAGGCIGSYNGLNVPRDALAYQDVDLRVAKDFVIAHRYKFGAYFAVYNAFDHINRAYSAWGAGSSPTLESNGDGTVGLARTYQIGGKFSF